MNAIGFQQVGEKRRSENHINRFRIHRKLEFTGLNGASWIVFVRVKVEPMEFHRAVFGGLNEVVAPFNTFRHHIKSDIARDPAVVD